jgi:hypothetical protein
MGELSARSRERLVEAAGLSTCVSADGAETAAVIPVTVLQELLAEYILLANAKAHSNGEGNAQDLILRSTRSRMADDVARRAWYQANPDS